MPVATNISLTKEQQDAVETIVGSDRQVRTLGGYAGTGKTTVINELVRRLRGYAVCAYTGKAANVLRKKGISGTTIHSLIYHPVGDGGDVTFELVQPEEFCADGIIVDEASMVSKRIYDDLLSFDVPLVFVGDHGQLEPMGDSGFNLMDHPDVVLEKVHRNAGPIARFAESLRQGDDARDYKSNDAVRVTTMGAVGDLDINQSWQMICAYNRTRCDLNAMVREHVGAPAGIPQLGDRVMCLQNDRNYGLFNGMQGTIADIDPARRRLTFESDQELTVRVPYNPQAFGSMVRTDYIPGVIPFDWCYCVTCHKAQGDEWDKVCVVEQRCGKWDHRRWAYTAASRAKYNLVWIVE